MEWIVAIVVAAVLFFAWQGFRTRCPACGVMALHFRDAIADAEQRETYEFMKSSGILNSLDEAGSSLGSRMSKPGYENARFRCKSCAQQFSRRMAIEWLTIRNKLGEERALAEYKKLK